MQNRGGQQRIPRPEITSVGPPPPWSHLDAQARRFDLASIRDAFAEFEPRAKPPRNPVSRDAAVLVALFDRDGESRVILTKRPDTMPSHQGEIAFPGGKHDPATDSNLASTALREAHEEVALEPLAVEVVGELDTLSTVASQFVITPYVGLIETPQLLVPHAREVISVFDVALSELLDPQTHRSELWHFANGPELTIHFYELPGETVWGATARILTNLLTALCATR